jgi:hypothetical protein
MILITVIVAEDDKAAKEMLETGYWMPGWRNLPAFDISQLDGKGKNKASSSLF